MVGEVRNCMTAATFVRRARGGERGEGGGGGSSHALLKHETGQRVRARAQGGGKESENVLLIESQLRTMSGVPSVP